MNYKNITVPYLTNARIEGATGLFREKFWGDSVPVDIEHIIDVKLKINVVPIPGFLKHANIDALISSDWKSIYVDRDEYLDERRHNRLRFSLAHEIGHFVLHKKIYTDFGIKSLEDYYKLNSVKTAPIKAAKVPAMVVPTGSGVLLEKIRKIDANPRLRKKIPPASTKIAFTFISCFLSFLSFKL